jgi:LPS-assembly protein
MPKLPPPIHPVARRVAYPAPRALAQPSAAPRHRARLRTALGAAAGAAAVALALVPALPEAQVGLPGLGNRAASDEPVTFTADEVEFDQNTDTVTARGRVEAWQGDRVVRADAFTYNRTTGVATAQGNVVLIEPDGQALFTDRAELSGGMRDAALEGLRGLLAGNARVAAAGARRTGGDITDLARVVYSPCDLCAEDPTRPPLWQLRARIASLHGTEQRVRYRDAAVQIAGVPVLYTPYLSHASPDAPRASGFLSPTLGLTRFLGGFVETPYYWAIDDHSDATVSPTFSTSQAPNLAASYQRRFNAGDVRMEGSIGSLRGDEVTEDGLGGHFFSSARFSLDENWRTTIGVNRASSTEYLRAWRFGSPRVLTTSAELEGFWGTEGYARFDARGYQSLDSVDNTSQLPFVLPLGYGEYVFPRDRFGGQASVDAMAFNILRSEGTDSRRVGARAGYELPMVGPLGDVWTLRGVADAMNGFVQDIQLAPNFGNAADNGAYTRAHARGALDWRWPLMRDAGAWGAQIIEPRVQLVGGPSIGQQNQFPNEDSLDLEFTDATLFQLNRWPGRDRLEGGGRVDAALRGAWLFPNGGQVEGLFGRSYLQDAASIYPTGSGLERQRSDYVGRLRLAPVSWFEVLGRGRLDSQSTEPRLWDTTATVFADRFSLSVGYLLTQPEQNVSTTQREEISLGGRLQLTKHWRVGAFGRYDIARERFVAGQAVLTYEDECLIFETRLAENRAIDTTNGQQYASGTVLLFRVALKTIGDFGIRAL